MAKKIIEQTKDELKKEIVKLKKAKQKLDKKEKTKVKKVDKKEKTKVKKVDKKEKTKVKKVEPKQPKPKKLTKAEQARIREEEAKRKAEEERTYEEQLQEELSDEEIENFNIAKLDMNKLIGKVCELLVEKGGKGMLQTDIWKKFKLDSKDGSRLSLKMERMGYLTREKGLHKGRWTYTLFIKKSPINFESIMYAPCLTCTVEQKCSLENELPEPSPRNCELIEQWVVSQYSKTKKKK